AHAQNVAHLVEDHVVERAVQLHGGHVGGVEDHGAYRRQARGAAADDAGARGAEDAAHAVYGRHLGEDHDVVDGQVGHRGVTSAALARGEVVGAVRQVADY